MNCFVQHKAILRIGRVAGTAVVCLFFLVLHASGREDIPDKNGFHWIPNHGQWPDAVQYRAELPAGRLFLENQGLTYAFLNAQQLKEYHHRKFYEGKIDAHALKVRFKGANPDPEIVGKQTTNNYYNFFLGADATKWASKVFGKKAVHYRSIYDDIDLSVFAREGRLKYNFYVAPDGDPAAVKMHYDGADTIFLEDGYLHVQTSVNEFRELAPVAYQQKDGKRRKVACDFKINDDAGTVEFVFPEGYDEDKELVIDPEVIFSTFSGSLADNFGYTATFDSAGNGYSGGTVFGPKFPTTSGAYQVNWAGGSNNTSGIGVGGARDIGILKYNDSGTNVKYITYLGGAHNEDPHSMIVDHKGDLLVFGNTGSSDFPTPGNSYQSNLNGAYDMIVARLSVDGSTLKGATYLGGSDRDGLNGAQGFFPGMGYTNSSPLGFNYGDIFRGEVIVDSSNDVWIASVTKSSDYPVSNSALQQNYGGGTQDACVSKLSEDLSSLEYSTLLGGPGDDAAYSIALSDKGGVYVAGGTESQNFPFNLSSGHLTQNQGGPADGFAFYLSSNLSNLKGSTFLGTSGYDQIYFLQTGPSGNVYVTGQTNSDQFPNFNTQYSTNNGRQFVSKFNQALDNLFWSATFGSGRRKSPDLSPSAFLVDECGRIFFSGWGGGSNFQGHTGNLDVTQNAFQPITDGSDFYLAVFARDMQKLLYGSYYGGGTSNEHVDGGTSRFDEHGIVYQSVCAGCGGYSDLPTTPNAWSSTNKGIRPNGDSTGCNNALLKIDLKAKDLFGGFNGPENACISTQVKFNNTSQLANSYYWDFGDGDTSSKANPTHKYNQAGKYEVTMVAKNLNSCALTDTVKDSILIYDQVGAEFSHDTVQCAGAVAFEYDGRFGNEWYWEFGDSSLSREEAPVHAYRDTGWYEVTLYVDSGSACADTSTDSVHISDLPDPRFSYEIDTCPGKFTFDNQSLHSDSFLWVFEDSVERPQADTGTFIHYYESVGDLSAKLIAQPGSLCADTTSENFRLETPKVGLRAEVVDTCDFRYALIDETRYANTSHWFLETGDTFQMNTDTLFYQFPGPGEYEVKMIAEDQRKVCVDSMTKTVIVDSLPDADFTFSKANCSSFIEITNVSRHSDHYRWKVRALNQPYDTTYSTLNDQRIFLPYPGEVYEVALIADPRSDCSDTIVRQVNLDSAAYADFELALDTCKSQVRFRNTSNQQVDYDWDFGDGNNSGQKAPLHTYAEPDFYEVTLYVENKGCRDTAKKSFRIPEVPQANFSLDRAICSPVVEIDNQSEYANRSYEWRVESDTVIYANIEEYQFKDTGSYVFRLVAGPYSSCPDTMSQTISLDEFAFSPFEVKVDSCSGKVGFEHPMDSLGTYKWDFGNGDTSVMHEPVYTYDTSGSYKVRLINNMRGCTDTSVEMIEIINPKASFAIDRKFCSPEVRFENLSKGSDHRKWHFGDSATSTKRNPIHTYEDTGSYRVKLVANHHSQCADTFSIFMNLNHFVQADYSLSQDPCMPKVSVTNKSLRADSIYWDLGFEGAYPRDSNALNNVEFPRPGSYEVTLKVLNNECKDSLSQKIFVDSTVQAGFSAHRIPCSPRVELKDTSTYGKGIHWFFGDGNEQSGERRFEHLYRQAGNFTITQVINPRGQCRDTARQEVEVALNEVTQVKVPNVFTPNGDGKNDKFKIKGIEGCKDYKITIYNRWGDLVFRDSGQSLQWDGKDLKNHNVLNSGTFYYTLENGSFQQEGTITLIR